MDLRRQLAVLRHRLWLLVAAVVLGAVAAYAVTGVVPKSYEATSTVIVGQSLNDVNPDYNQILTSTKLSSTYALLATSRPLLERVAAQLNLGISGDELMRRVSADAPRDLTIIRITARSGDPAQAAAIANAVTDELRAASPALQGQRAEAEKFINEQLVALQAQIQASQAEVSRLSAIAQRSVGEEQQLQTTQGRLVTLRSTYASLLGLSSNSASNLLTVMQPAIAPDAPASPRPLLNTILAAVLALAIAIAAVFLIEYLDDTLKSSDDVEAVTGLPTLGAIARMKGEASQGEMYRLATLMYPRSPIAEGYRALRTNIEFSRVDEPLRTLLVTSSVPGEGKTVTAGNVAIAFAQAGRKTLLVDADMRKPGVHRLFALPNAHGLSTLFRSDEFGIAAVVHPTEQDNLSVLTSGPLPPNPAELLGSKRFQGILGRLRTEYELVIIDSPPLEVVTDAALLASVVDGTVFVINAGRTRRPSVARGREALAKSGGQILGVVMNKLPHRARGGYYDYYASYGGYGSGAEDGGVPATPRAAKPAK